VGRLGGCLRVVRLCEAPGVAAAAEVEPGESRTGAAFPECCRVVLCAPCSQRALGALVGRARVPPVLERVAPTCQEGSASVPAGCFILCRVSEHCGPGSQATQRLHHLPSVLFLGKALGSD